MKEDQKIKFKRETDGRSKLRLYKIRRGMKSRCYNKNVPSYKNYGGRGITICDRWKIFKNFYDDNYEEYNIWCGIRGEKKISIDRYPNNNGGYSPNNTRWAIIKEQSNNRRKRRYLYNGKYYLMKTILNKGVSKRYFNKNCKKYYVYK